MTLVELGSAVGLALNTVREHKMRSFLTVLGVIIGTGTIIGVGSIIAGLDGAITNVLRSFNQYRRGLQVSILERRYRRGSAPQIAYVRGCGGHRRTLSICHSREPLSVSQYFWNRAPNQHCAL